MDIGLTLEVTQTRNTFESLIDFIFAIDIALNFFTGYIDDMNILVMN
jgi:hypothetical protein